MAAKPSISISVSLSLSEETAQILSRMIPALGGKAIDDNAAPTLGGTAPPTTPPTSPESTAPTAAPTPAPVPAPAPAAAPAPVAEAPANPTMPTASAPVAPVSAPVAPPPAPAAGAPQTGFAPAIPQAAPTAAPAYTVDQISKAGADLVQAGQMAGLMQLLQQFGVRAVTELPAAQYGAFAAALRGLGAQL